MSKSDTNDSLKYFPSQMPQLLTKRLLLREITSLDQEQVIKCLNNYNISKFLGHSMVFPFEQKDFIEFLPIMQTAFKNKQRVTFAICYNHTPSVLIGSIILFLFEINENAKVGYYLIESEWGKGVVTEALTEIIRYGFKELHLHKIDGIHIEENKASGRVMEKCGMVREMMMVKQGKKFGKYVNLVQCGIINKEQSK